MFDQMIAETAWKLAEQREQAMREIARSYLPRPLRWLVGRPRALAVAYRVRPRWRPTIVTGTDGGISVSMTTDAAGSRYVVTETFGHKRS